ncbi:MAG: hemin uptake protein HemP [Pirellulales bacterium]
MEARVLRSDEILDGRREVIIEHGSEIYRLRLTRNGKLILQK